MKKLIIGLIVIVVLFAIGILVVGRVFYPDNIAETSVDGGEKRLKARFYETEISKVHDAAKEVIEESSSWGSNWRLLNETPTEDSVILEAEIPVVVFTDDLKVTLEKVEDNKVRVNVRSESRVGKSDFGENARNVRKFLSALDAKMNS